MDAITAGLKIARLLESNGFNTEDPRVTAIMDEADLD